MKMLKSWIIVLAVVGTILALPACSQGQPASISTSISSQQAGIWVTGTGKVSVTPDLATLSLGIQTQQSTVAQAQTDASRAMTSVISALKVQGIADKDIQTQRFNIQQVTRYDPQTQQNVVTGYQVNNIVTAKIRNLDSVGTIIDAAAAAGGDSTRVNGLNFSVEDPTRYYADARTKAVQDAQQTASRLAALSNVSLGKPTYISESAQSPPPTISPSVIMSGAVPAPALETPISPGQTDIILTVQVAYDIAK
jgi:uncharacterized protein YggE